MTTTAAARAPRRADDVDGARALRRPRTIVEAGVLGAQISRQWFSWGGAHGGLVMALNVEAARHAAGDKPLRAITTHFLAPVDDSPLELQTTVESSTANSTSMTIRTMQNDAPAAVTLATSVRPRPAPSVDHRLVMPPAPSPDRCAEFRDAELLFAFPRQLDIRPVDAVLPLSGSSSPVLTAWVRLRSGEVFDTAAAVMMLDALAPAAYAAWTSPEIMPTVQLSGHVLRDLDDDPHAGWVLVQQRHIATRDGVSVDECDVWTEDGEPVARGRQVRRILGSGNRS